MQAIELEIQTQRAIKSNWYALVATVLTNKNTERNLELVACVTLHSQAQKGSHSVKYSREDVEEMARLRREGMNGSPWTYDQVAEEYGTSGNAVYVTLRRWGMLEKGIAAGAPRGRKKAI